MPCPAVRESSCHGIGRWPADERADGVSLWDSIDEGELPAVEVSPIDSVRRDCEPMK